MEEPNPRSHGRLDCAQSGPFSPDSNPLTIDQLVQNRVWTSGDEPILAYPSSGTHYVDYTARQLDYHAYNAALLYAAKMPQRSSSMEKPRVVALLGPSNLDYVVAMFALTKLGHTVLFLSPRIPKEAHRSVLEQTNAQDLVVNESLSEIADYLRFELQDLKIHALVGEDLYSQPHAHIIDTRMDYMLNSLAETRYPAWIVHSSGSTSLPKPVYISHQAALSDYKLNHFGKKGFITMPLYYSHGISTLCKSFYSGKQVHLYNASLPIATQHLVKTLEQHHFDIFHAVPYTLKLLSEDEYAVQLLTRCHTVMYAGSTCPDGLGSFLTQRGVRLVCQYGT